MNWDMRLHSCIAQVDFEREHGTSFMILWFWVDIIFLNSCSLYCTFLKLLYIEMSSVKHKELEFFLVEYFKLSILSWYVLHWVEYHIVKVEYLISELSILSLCTSELSKLVVYCVFEYSLSWVSWKKVSMFSFLSYSSLCYALEFFLHRTFHVLSHMTCIFWQCRHMHSWSSTGASLLHSRVRVSYGKPLWFQRISFTFNLVRMLWVLSRLHLLQLET